MYWTGAACAMFPLGGFTANAITGTTDQGYWPHGQCGCYHTNGTPTITNGKDTIKYVLRSVVQPYYCRNGRIPAAEVAPTAVAGIHVTMQDSPVEGCDILL